MPMRHEIEDQAQPIHNREDDGDFLAQVIQRFGRFADWPIPRQYEIYGWKDQANRRQCQERRAEAGGGAVECLSAVKNAAGNNGEAEYQKNVAENGSSDACLYQLRFSIVKGE